MAPPTIAPARKPAPTPQPHPRPCTLSTVAGTAFLIASASATGIAGATVASEAMPAARTIVTANLRAQLLILLPPWCESPCEGSMVRIDVGANKAPPPSIGSINVGAYRPLRLFIRSQAAELERPSVRSRLHSATVFLYFFASHSAWSCAVWLVFGSSERTGALLTLAVLAGPVELPPETG